MTSRCRWSARQKDGSIRCAKRRRDSSPRTTSRRAFLEARVLILTLGQSEGWIDRRTGLAWGRRPLQDSDQFDARIFTLEENVAWLEESLTRLRALNPELDVLLTVSPVPRFATFAGA